METHGGKKVLAIIGSPNLEKSNTAALVSDFIASMRELDPGIEAEVVSLGREGLSPCQGCWACTRTGECSIRDGLPGLKEKMLACDLLILGSPVYVDSVSAQAKAFIDRIYVWLHVLRLLGKPAITAVTTANSGAAAVERYLGTVLLLLGAIGVGRLRGIGYQPGVMPLREAYKKRHGALARKAVRILNGELAPRPGLMNRLAYLSMRAKARFGAEWLPYEHEYWSRMPKSFSQAYLRR